MKLDVVGVYAEIRREPDYRFGCGRSPGASTRDSGAAAMGRSPRSVRRGREPFSYWSTTTWPFRMDEARTVNGAGDLPIAMSLRDHLGAGMPATPGVQSRFSPVQTSKRELCQGQVMTPSSYPPLGPRLRLSPACGQRSRPMQTSSGLWEVRITKYVSPSIVTAVGLSKGKSLIGPSWVCIPSRYVGSSCSHSRTAPDVAAAVPGTARPRDPRWRGPHNWARSASGGPVVGVGSLAELGQTGPFGPTTGPPAPFWPQTGPVVGAGQRPRSRRGSHPVSDGRRHSGSRGLEADQLGGRFQYQRLVMASAGWLMSPTSGSDRFFVYCPATPVAFTLSALVKRSPMFGPN